MITPEPAACARLSWDSGPVSGKPKNLRKNGSLSSGFSSASERKTTAMLTTAGVTCSSIGANVSTPLDSSRSGARATLELFSCRYCAFTEVVNPWSDVCCHEHIHCCDRDDDGRKDRD
jgi:hypothetical protein